MLAFTRRMACSAVTAATGSSESDPRLCAERRGGLLETIDAALPALR